MSRGGDLWHLCTMVHPLKTSKDVFFDIKLTSTSTFDLFVVRPLDWPLAGPHGEDDP